MRQGALGKYRNGKTVVKQYLKTLPGEMISGFTGLPAVTYRAQDYRPRFFTLSFPFQDTRGVYFNIKKAAPRFAGVREPGSKPGIAINTSVFAATITVHCIIGQAGLVQYRFTLYLAYPARIDSR
jgi:hypothetical protein